MISANRFEQNIKFLTDIEVDLYYPHRAHPMSQVFNPKQNFKIEISPLCFGVRCLVLLPCLNQETKEQILAWQQLLESMLKVLELDNDDLAVARIFVDDFSAKALDWEQISKEINIWQPQYVLQFECSAGLCVAEGRGACTFHPKHLLESPQDKRVAYNDLLLLKQMLADF